MYTAFSNWLWKLSEEFTILNDGVIRTFIDQMSPKIMELSTSLASKLIPWMYEASVAVIQWLITIVIAVVVSVYLLSDKQLIFRTIKRISYAFLPKQRVDSMIVVVKNCNDIFTGYVTAQALDALIVGVLCFLLMSLLRLPYALLISVIVGLTNMIPYFGPYIGAVPGICILAALKFKYGLIFAVMIFVLQQFDGPDPGTENTRRFHRASADSDLICHYFRRGVFGVFGLFLGVPVVAVLQYLLNLLIDRRMARKREGLR